MVWFINRHVYYIKSEDFISLLTLLHLCSMILTGYGIKHHCGNLSEIRSNIWALVLASGMFVVCLCFANFTKTRILDSSDRRTDDFFKWFLPLIVSSSLICFITLSSYHGVILIFALYLSLATFVLTGFPCCMLILICLSSIGFGMGCQVVLVSNLYNSNNGYVIGGFLEDLAATLRYGASRRGRVVLLDMILLFLQVFGGIIAYSRFSKLGHLLSIWKHDPARFLGNFMALRDLEEYVMLQKSYDSDRCNTISSLSSVQFLQVKMPQPVHKAPDPLLSQPSLLSVSSFDLDALSSAATKHIPLIEEGDEVDAEWINFCNENMSILPRRRYIFEVVEPCQSFFVNKDQQIPGLPDAESISNPLPLERASALTSIDSHASSMVFCQQKMQRSNLNLEEIRRYYKPKSGGYIELLLNEKPQRIRCAFQSSIAHGVAPIGSHSFGDLPSTDHQQAITSNLSIGELPLRRSIQQLQIGFGDDRLRQRLTTTSQDTSSRVFVTDRSSSVYDAATNCEANRNLRLTLPSNVGRSCNNSVHSEYSISGGFRRLTSYGDLSSRFENSINNPFLKRLFRVIPRSVRSLLYVLFGWSIRLCDCRNIISKNCWTESVALPPMNRLGIFMHTRVENWYVEWMHEFNICFYKHTALEMLFFVVYATVMMVVASIRHYWTLDKDDAQIFLSTIRIIILSLRFGFCPIVGFVFIVPLLFNKTPKKMICAQDYYCKFLLLCLVYWAFGFADMCTSIGLKHPGFALQNSFSMLVLLSLTSIVLCTRLPTFLVLYFLYFVSFLVAHLCFSKHIFSRYLIMEVFAQAAIGIGTLTFMAYTVDANRRRLFVSFALPYIVYLEKLKSYTRHRSLKSYTMEIPSQAVPSRSDFLDALPSINIC